MCTAVQSAVSGTMSVSPGMHHQLCSSSSYSSSSSCSPASLSSSAAVGTRQRQVTDHSVETLLRSSPPMSNVDESCITLPAYHSDAAHSLLARSLSHVAAADVLLPSAEDALSPVGCRLETSSCHGVDVTDCDVMDRTVTVCLEHKDLWSRFKTLGTEMVITKSGRYLRLLHTV